MDTEHTSRRLAAILAADVVGYSRMMAEDETGTLKALNQHRRAVFDPVVSQHNGRIVKLMGDGTLVEFASVVDAVNCAVALQQEIAVAPQGDPRITLRIGINLGDIITQGDDIFGDGVNIAARLEALAQPGGICVSGVVNESAGGRIKTRFRDGGTVQVKNIDRPLRVFHWHPDTGETATATAAPAPRQTTASIAVLPFDNMSGDPEQEFFSDGISEDIITDLSKVSGLTVIARNSSFAYKGKAVDLRVVGRELGVTSVLEGSVRRAGQRVRITAQLIDAVTGAHLWADRFDRDLTDIFAVQDEVTLEIVNALKVKLSPAERASIASVGTTNMQAHEYYMRMRGYLFFPGMDSALWKRAVDFGERAIQLDPDYAQAHSILAMMYLLDYHNNWSGNAPGVSFGKAETLVKRGLDLDPDGASSNHVAAVLARWSGDFERALAAIEKTLSQSPDLALALFTRGEILQGVGRLEESISDLERAIRLDPAFSHQYLQFLGMSHFLRGNYETAAMVFRERVVLAHTTDIGRAWLAATLGHLGQIDEARQVWSDLRRINPDFDMSARVARLRYPDPSFAERIWEGLTKAGLSA